MFMAGWRFVAMVLLVLVAAGPLSLRGLAIDSAQPAGCHFHGGQPSSLQPVDYACCRSGHDVPLVEAAAAVVPSAYFFDNVLAPTERLPLLSRTVTLSGGPPISPPLLI
jgi:hypothetical protein